MASCIEKKKTVTADFKALFSLKLTSNDNLPRNVLESKVHYLSMKCSGVKFRS